MARQPTEVDKEIDVLAEAFAVKIDGLANGAFLRDGVLKEAISAVIWALYHRMPDQRTALEEVLEIGWPEIIREAAAHDHLAESANGSPQDERY